MVLMIILHIYHLSFINALLSLLNQEILIGKNMAETIILQIPEAFYHRLAILFSLTSL